jgi:hypothetical protein
VGDLASRIQTYLVKTPEHTIVIDTCVGNDKRREGSALWHMRAGGYLDDLAAAGVTPEQVDFVVCTHLHVDHVGWNTRFVDGRWVPTFPRARYIFVGEEWEYWRHEKDECIATASCPWSSTGRWTSSRATMPSAAGSGSSPRRPHPGPRLRAPRDERRARRLQRRSHAPGRAGGRAPVVEHLLRRSRARGGHAPRLRRALCRFGRARPRRALSAPGYIVREGGGTRFTPAA